MLHRPKEVAAQLEALVAEAQTASAMAAAEKMFAVAPDFAPGLLGVALARREAGDLDGAEDLLWKTIEVGPCGAAYFLILAQIIRVKEGAESALAASLRRMGLQKLSGADQVPPLPGDILEDLAPEGGPAEWDLTEPETFQLMLEGSAAGTDPIGDDGRLLPYRLLADLQQQAPRGVEEQTLQRILENGERCLPVWRAAFREWVGSVSDLSQDCLALMVAIMGEICTAEDVEDLWELSGFDDIPLFRHTHYALFRFGQRHPEAALAAIRAQMPDADVGLRCGLAEQLVVLGELAGVTETLLDLVEDFPKIARDEDVPYLLMLVTHGLAMHGQAAKVTELLARNRRHLSKEGRRWFEEMMEAGDFVPMVVATGIDELSIERVVLEYALMDDDQGEEYLDDDEENHDHDHTPHGTIVKPIRPGRNDPCWCGSGKKYKKCHLDSDERGGAA